MMNFYRNFYNYYKNMTTNPLFFVGESYAGHYSKIYYFYFYLVYI